MLLCNRSKRGKKGARSEKIGKNAAAYAAERFVLQETFLKLKSAAYKRERLQIKRGL